MKSRREDKRDRCCCCSLLLQTVNSLDVAMEEGTMALAEVRVSYGVTKRTSVYYGAAGSAMEVSAE